MSDVDLITDPNADPLDQPSELAQNDAIPDGVVMPEGPVHFSRLKKIRLSPAHYLEAEEAATTSTRKGDGTHSVLLGSKPVVVFRDGVRNKKSAKWIDFQAEHEGKCILIPSEAGDVVGMRRSIERHGRALALLGQGAGDRAVREALIDWQFAGRACAGTPDVVLLDGLPAMRFRGRNYPACEGKVVVELKTSKTAAPWSFPWEARRYAYPTQVSWYKEGIERTPVYPAGEVSDAFIVVVESTAPYPVTVFHVDPRALSKARMEWRGWMDRLLECERRGEFPAYTDDDVELGLDDEAGLDWDREAAA